MRPEPIVNFGYPMPAVRILVPMVAGMFAGWYWEVCPFTLIVFGGSMVVFSLPLVSLTRGKLNAAWVQGLTLLVCIALAGMLMMRLAVEQIGTPPLEKFDSCELTGVVIREPIMSTQGYRLKIRVLDVRNEEGEPLNAGFMAWWYAPALPEVSRLLHGDTLITQSVFFPLEQPSNPSTFDFQAWSKLQGVSGVFRYSEQFSLNIAPSSRSFSPIRKALALRQKQIEVLGQYMAEGRELAVGMAILLGKRDDIESDLRQAYADTGAVHVLAVSGLHVGIVAFVLKWLLGIIIPSFRGEQWVRLAFNLAGIWAFALITGLPPSVQRASIMFSLFIIGITLSKRRNGYNTLAVAATIMLIIDPLLLFDVGFRLSFAAVWGILFFHPRIYPLIPMPVAWMDAAWSLLAVSLAATLGTLPFTLYYFNQFPVFFWLSGWVVIPAATLIVWLGLSTLLAGNLAAFGGILDQLAWLLAQLLYGVIWIMNAVVFMIQSMPMAVIRNIIPGTEGFFLLIALLTLVAAWVKFRNSLTRGFTCICVAALGLLYCHHTWHATRTVVKVTYALRQGNMTSFYMQGKMLSFYDQEGADQQNRIDPPTRSGSIKEQKSVRLDEGEQATVIVGNTCFILGDNILLDNIPCSYLIPFDNRLGLPDPPINAQSIRVISGGTLPDIAGGQNDIDHHNLSQQGAHILSIKHY